MVQWWWVVAAAIIATTLLFAVQVAVDPGMDGIVFRVGPDGAQRFTPLNVLRLMAAPLAIWTPVGRAFWTTPELAAVNWPLIVAAATAFGLLLVAVAKRA